jgi:hypothetical protein
MEYIYIDNSNLYIEGRRVSAVVNKLAGSIIEAMNNGILDQGYTISFGKLHEFLTGNDFSKIKRVALFGSRSEEGPLCLGRGRQGLRPNCDRTDR